MRRQLLALLLLTMTASLSGCAIEDLFGGRNSDERYLNKVNPGNQRTFGQE
jgi:hypothetical protein